MSVYETADIRNVVLVGHQGAGKTMLAEAMLFASGAINRLGSIEAGSTVADYHPIEKQKQMSVFASPLRVDRDGVKINVLDAPGYPDFAGEVVVSLRVADTAVFVVNAVDGVQVGTEIAWGYAAEASKPVLFVVNHVDKQGVDFASVHAELQERFGRAATIVQFPAGEGSRAIVDVLLMKQLTWEPGRAEPRVEDIGESLKDRASELHTTLVENIAENDEALMELYLDKGELTEDEMRAGLCAAMLGRQIFPVVATSATELVGVARLLDLIKNCCPSPKDAPGPKTVQGEELPCDPDGEPVAFVYRTLTEQHVGEYFFFRVLSGALEQGMDLTNAQTGSAERLGSVFVLNGNTREPAPKMSAGDLGAFVKLKDTSHSHTLRPKNSKVEVAPIELPPPRYGAAVKTTTAGEEDKLSMALHRLTAEDPSLRVTHDTELNQMLLSGLGEMQLEIARFHIKERFGVEVSLSVPKVSYRETVQNPSRASYRHKKQTGGAGQFADISLAVEPAKGDYKPPPDIKVRDKAKVETEWGASVEFVDAIVSGVIDMRRFSGAIQKGVLEAMAKGPIAGYPVGGLRVIVYDGKMHSVDSNEAAFKTASRQCFREAFMKADPIMLEPVFNLEVSCPDEYTGDVISDLNTRRARIQGMDAEGSVQKIKAQAPEVELLRYSTQLRSLTHGRGVHSASFYRYEAMPKHVQDKVAEEAAKAKAEGEG